MVYIENISSNWNYLIKGFIELSFLHLTVFVNFSINFLIAFLFIFTSFALGEKILKIFNVNLYNHDYNFELISNYLVHPTYYLYNIK